NFSTPAATNSRSPIRAPTNRPVSNAPVYPQFNQTGPPVVSGSSSNAAITSQSPVPGPIPAPHDEYSEGIYIKSGSNDFIKLNHRQLDQLGKQLMVRVIHTDITGLNESHIGMQKDVIKFRRYEIVGQVLREDFRVDVGVVEGKLEELQGLSEDKWKSEQPAKAMTLQIESALTPSQNNAVATSHLPNVASVTRGNISFGVLHNVNQSLTDISSRNAAASTSAPLPPPSSVPQTSSSAIADSNVNNCRKRKSSVATTSRTRKPKVGAANEESTNLASGSTMQISTQSLGVGPSSMSPELVLLQNGQNATTPKKKPTTRKPRVKKTPAVAGTTSNLAEQALLENADVAAAVSAALAAPPPPTNPAMVNQYSGQELANAVAQFMSSNSAEQVPHENADLAATVSAALDAPQPPANPAIVNQFYGQDLMNSLMLMAANGLAAARGHLPSDSGLHTQNVHTSNGLQASFNAPPYFGQPQQNPVQLKSTSSLNPTQTYFNNNTFVQMPHQHLMNPGRQASNVFVTAAAPVPVPIQIQPTVNNNISNNNNNNAFVQTPLQHRSNFGPQGSSVFMSTSVPLVPAPIQAHHQLANMSNNNNDDFGVISRQYARRFRPSGSDVNLTPPAPTQGAHIQTAPTDATLAQADAIVDFSFDGAITDATDPVIGALETDVSQPSAQTDLTSLDSTRSHLWEGLFNQSTGVPDLLNQPMALPPLNNSIQDMPLANSPAFGDISTSTRQKRRQEDDGQDSATKKHRTSQN
ncbi:hypothetical protein HDU76_005433, partial [Blyttiomyces sp. JEL0837]